MHVCVVIILNEGRKESKVGQWSSNLSWHPCGLGVRYVEGGIIVNYELKEGVYRSNWREN